MEDKLFELLGLGVPFYLGGRSHVRGFSWLDNNAFDEVTPVISSWPRRFRLVVAGGMAQSLCPTGGYPGNVG